MRWLPAVLLASACVSPLSALHSSRTVHIDQQQIELRWSEDDADTQMRLGQALARAVPVLGRWGGLLEPVTLSVLPNHAALERASGRHGYAWLRAWGRYDEIWLQSPRSWPVPPRDSDTVEWLTHELTHCLLFQHTSTRETWEHRPIPFWFREGMAIVTARQAYRYASLEDLAAWQLVNPSFNVFTLEESATTGSFTQAYGLSLHAMTFLLRRYGDAAVINVMKNMKNGDVFEVAFARSAGISTQAFGREFMNYLRLRGFRGLGLPVRR